MPRQAYSINSLSAFNILLFHEYVKVKQGGPDYILNVPCEYVKLKDFS